MSELTEEKYLSTYGLASNFYYNLVLWSHVDGRLAIGVDSEVFWWDGQGGVEPVEYEPDHRGTVTCVSCLKSGMLAITTQDGRLFVQPEARGGFFSHRFPSALKCVAWVQNANSHSTFFVVGDVNGFVYFGEIQPRGIYVILEISVTSQQVCGM